MTLPARAERFALCDLFAEVGPDAPTLCGEWTTRDLAAHLVVREGRPDAAAGIVLGPLAGYTERIRLATATRPWEDLISEVREGPPVWSPMRLASLDRLSNTVEFFVHHEDVRRAQPGWSARTLDHPLQADLARALSHMARLLARKAPGGLVLTTPEVEAGMVADALETLSVTAKKGSPSVTVRGWIGELVLFVYGRQAHAVVELEGPGDLADAMRSASFGV